MAKIKVEHQTSHDPEKAFSILKDFLSNDPEFRRFDPKMRLDFRADSNNIDIKCSQFTAVVNVHPSKGGNPGSFVVVDLDIAFMLSPFKGKIQESMQKTLAKYLA